MKKLRWSLLWMAFLLLALLIARPAVLASFDALGLNWWTVDSGGGRSSGGSYAMSGAIGQPDTGASFGGGYAIAGGFWVGVSAAPPERHLFLPLIQH